MDMLDARYTLCAQCDHFVEPNDSADPTVPLAYFPGAAAFIHLDDGEKEHDHDAVPGDETHTLREWQARRPDLFRAHRDGKIGPNSAFHTRA